MNVHEPHECWIASHSPLPPLPLPFGLGPYVQAAVWTPSDCVESLPFARFYSIHTLSPPLIHRFRTRVYRLCCTNLYGISTRVGCVHLFTSQSEPHQTPQPYFLLPLRPLVHRALSFNPLHSLLPRTGAIAQAHNDLRPTLLKHGHHCLHEQSWLFLKP